MDETESSALVVERACTMIVDWELANAPNATVSTDQILSSSNLGDGSSTSVPHHGIRWQHPLPGRYKCNIDAAFSNSLNRTGIGICIRESDGSFVLAKTEMHLCLLPVDVGEALGLHLALQWLSDMQFDNVDFETDSKLTADAFLRLNLAAFLLIVVLSLALYFLTLGWSLLDDKLKGSLMHLQEMPHY